MLAKMQPREVSFDEQLVGLREQVSAMHMRDGEYAEAAKVGRRFGVGMRRCGVRGRKVLRSAGRGGGAVTVSV